MSYGIALLGAGRIGQVHARAVSTNRRATLVGVADAMDAAATALASEHNCAVNTAEHWIQSDAVDGVIIATPTDTHADLIEQCVKAGKAVFCEKPIDLDAERVRSCLAVVEAHQGRLMVGFNRRFDAHFMALKAAIANGKVGQVEQVVITSRDPSPPPVDYIKRSGGIFRDMMIHDFDMARFLLGEEPVSVSASGACLVDPALEGLDFDTATATLTTASGQQCVITNSRRASYGYDQRAEVHGSAGMAAIDNPKMDLLTSADGDGYKSGPLHDFFMTRYTEAYARELDCFVNWLAGEAVDVPTGADGLASLLLADAAEESAASGCRVTVKGVGA